VRQLCAPLVVAAVLALLAGSSTAARQSTSHGTGRTPEQQRMAAVILRWSMRLNANDNDGIARLYSLPALIVQGAYAYRLVNRHQLALWYSGLPCSGTIVRIVFHGRFATAVFRLGDRGKTKCDAPGELAAARFEIVRGKIRSWVQVDVPPAPGAGPVA
jgi:hypothetical protein